MWKDRVRDRFRRLEWKCIYYGPQRDVTVDTFNGRLTFNSREHVIGQDLFVRRSYEADLMQDSLALLRQEGFLGSGNTIIDVGANIGMTCIAFLKHAYFQRAIAFEPAPNSYRLLVCNIHQNGLEDRIRHFPYALSSTAGEFDLELSGNNSGDHRLRHARIDGAFGEEHRRTVRVPVRTLDQVLADHSDLNQEEVSLIWLDIQGHEGQFLEGAVHLLQTGVPVVSEFWPYAILRSGISRTAFCRIVAAFFAHFYLLSNKPFQKLPISHLESMFDGHSGPDQFCQLALLPRR